MALVAVFFISAVLPAATGPIFPAPREMAPSGADFILDDHVVIAVPAFPSEQDLFLARELTHDLGDRFDLHLKMERLSNVPVGRRLILMGSVSNPLVADYCAGHALNIDSRSPGPDGYILRTDSDLAVVAGGDDRGAFYGFQSLRQIVSRNPAGLLFRGTQIRDWPAKPFRGLKLYLPGRANIPFFKRFIRDFMALYKYNTLIMEMNASMRLDRHPELNTGWVKFYRETTYWRQNYPPGTPHDWDQNSTHQDTADGGFLEKSEVADLAAWVRQYHIELVPELPSFTHSYYLLSAHPELAEVPGVKWPDTYCPSNPASYKLLFDVYDEYIDLLKPAMIHAGHDELFLPVGLCPRCKDKDIRERYGEDVRKIHDYLAAKGIRLAIWGDMLLEGVRGKGLQDKKTSDGYAYKTPGAMTPEQVERLVPKDILLFNWFWAPEEGVSTEQQAEGYEAQLEGMGFQEVFGNLTPDVRNYSQRFRRTSILGGAPSAWFATNEANFGKDLLSDFLGSAYMLWRGDSLGGSELSGVVQAMAPEIRNRFRGEDPPSETESAIAPVDISGSFNHGPVDPGLAIDLNGIENGKVVSGKVPFDLTAGGKNAVMVGTDGTGKTGLPREAVLTIGEDATSLVFLQASAKPATNKESFRLLYDQDDTADLLGWYEVVYEDGFVVTVPIRYGVNIQEWNWAKRTSARDYCYGADAVSAGGGPANPITFFAFEWKNPRLGKVIREVKLKGTTGFRGGSPEFINGFGPVIPNNAVILKAVSAVKKRG
ncbi:MAG: glycoside hydrolase family 20 zincin-like fold domain-containing protein [Bryobacteraceae bacterium]